MPAGSDAARLYVIAGSHACRTGMLMLEHKSVPYRTVTLPTGLHPLAVRIAGFPGNPTPIREVDGSSAGMVGLFDRLGTVPALSYRGERVQTNTRIALFLDRLLPDPPLYPRDPPAREQVEQARLLGDGPLQMAARRAVLSTGTAGLDRLHERGGRGRLGPLLAGNAPMRRILSGMAARNTFDARPEREAELTAAVMPLLDEVDALIGRGVLNGEQLNAADFAIAPSLALLDYRLDLREGLRSRPLYELVERLLPEPA